MKNELSMRWLNAVTLSSLLLATAACGSDAGAEEAPGALDDARVAAREGSTGSDAAADGSDGALASECEALRGPVDPTLLIDDLEDQNALIAQVASRNGSWWLTGDGSSGSSSEPPSDQAPLPELLVTERCGSRYAMRITGQGFSDWGAVLTVAFRFTNDLEPIDASAFSGFRFWARVGEQNTSAVRVLVQDGNTHEAGGVCDPADMVGERACYNGYGTDVVPLSTQWRLFEIPFERLAQDAFFGLRSDGLDRAALYAIDWRVDPNSVFDLWIDDVWFYE